MQVHAFRGEGRVFAFTGDSAGANLPARLGPWTAFKSMEMVRDDALPGVDVAECLDDLAAYGFHITDAHRRITGEVAG